jgi:hypothetical protein
MTTWWTTFLHAGTVKPLSLLGGEHRRLRHIGRNRLLELAKGGELTARTPSGVVNDTFKISDCDVCQQFKATRYPKKKHSPRGTRNAELIHVDITGPSAPSLAGMATSW